MKKRLFLNILAFCVLLSALSSAVFAAETEKPTQTATEAVRAADECGEGIKWSLADGVLTITGSGKMDDFLNGAPWYDNRDSITKLVLSGGITYIGEQAFKDCDSLETVDFGNALYEIGKEAFSSCDMLTAIELPSGFKIFGEASFQSCEKLTEIHCSGRFPSFKQNCLWATYATIYYPAESPWGVEYIEQLETAFNGRIQFIASDGTDPYVPTEAETEPEETEDATEVPTEAPTEPVTEPATEPAAEPVVTEEVTEAPTETLAEETEPAVQTVPGKSSGGWIGLVIVLLVLCLVVLGAVIFGARSKKGKYSSRGRYHR